MEEGISPTSKFAASIKPQKRRRISSYPDECEEGKDPVEGVHNYNDAFDPTSNFAPLLSQINPSLLSPQHCNEQEPSSPTTRELPLHHPLLEFSHSSPLHSTLPQPAQHHLYQNDPQSAPTLVRTQAAVDSFVDRAITVLQRLSNELGALEEDNNALQQEQHNLANHLDTLQHLTQHPHCSSPFLSAVFGDRVFRSSAFTPFVLGSFDTPFIVCKPQIDYETGHIILHGLVVSPSAQKLIGYSEDELLGDKEHLLMPTDSEGMRGYEQSKGALFALTQQIPKGTTVTPPMIISSPARDRSNRIFMSTMKLQLFYGEESGPPSFMVIKVVGWKPVQQIKHAAPSSHHPPLQRAQQSQQCGSVISPRDAPVPSLSSSFTQQLHHLPPSPQPQQAQQHSPHPHFYQSLQPQQQNARKRKATLTPLNEEGEGPMYLPSGGCDSNADLHDHF